ncbi:MAG TPA: leucyl/phenylalanyl-tRNA--protein transferase [Opitutaceae bacterium]|nr:leucyl/phenylalanyl-tRNA--protein transferase [Opitutaceae bacterium]
MTEITLARTGRGRTICGVAPASEFSWPVPDPADDIGLVALDYNLTPERLISAYRLGIFPWPDSAPFSPIPWVSPPRRAILEFADLHVPRNLRRSQRALAGLRFTVDGAFDAVIRECAAAPRPGQRGTWITPPMIAAYVEVHRRGHAHSVEAWQGGTLVGGLYGITAGGVFTGESMFHRIDDASKLCVLHLIEHLRSRGATWIDIQQLTPHFALLGAHEIPRAEFLERLTREQRNARPLFP